MRCYFKFLNWSSLQVKKNLKYILNKVNRFYLKENSKWSMNCVHTNTEFLYLGVTCDTIRGVLTLVAQL